MLNPAHRPIADPQFYLRKDVFVSFGKDSSVFLNLENDTYMGVDTDQAAALSLVVKGWPAMEGADEILERDAESFADGLVEIGLLTRDRATGKIASQASMEHPEDALVYREDPGDPNIRLSHVFRFLGSMLSGYLWWKLSPLDKTIRHFQQPRPWNSKFSDQTDVAQLRELIQIFYHVRPWFYEKTIKNPKKQTGLCLFDSFVLLNFLAKYRFYPTLVFGVQMRPFAAHSWVQEGRWILNGSPEFVAPYECIMAATRAEA